MTREDKILDPLSKAMTETLGLNIPVRVAIMRNALDQGVSISDAVRKHKAPVSEAVKQEIVSNE